MGDGGLTSVQGQVGARGERTRSTDEAVSTLAVTIVLICCVCVWWRCCRGDRPARSTGSNNAKVTLRVRNLTADVNPRTATVTLHWLSPEGGLQKINGYRIRFKPAQGSHLEDYSYWIVGASETCLSIAREFLQPLTLYTFEVQVEADDVSMEWISVLQFIGWYCRLPGCSKDRRCDNATRSISDWCCTDHYMAFATSFCLFPECSKCKQQLSSESFEDSNENSFCGLQHYWDAIDIGFAALVEVATTTEEYESVQRMFGKRWANAKGDCPRIKTILRVINPAAAKTFENYRSTLPPRYQTVEEYFHGTKLQCPITRFLEFCSNDSCGVCGIARRGFDLSRVRRHRWQRFGAAFYLAPNSSKSSDYPLDVDFSSTSSFQAVFLCNVAPGRKYEVLYNKTQLQGPPLGYHSVYGKAKAFGVFGDLNYEEIAVYNDEAILPMYVIFYSRFNVGNDESA